MPDKHYFHQILSNDEKNIFKKLNTPQKIQDFINNLEMRDDNTEPIVRSPRQILIKGVASCMEGALLAHAILTYHNYISHIIDLCVSKKNNKDSDHIITIFEVDGYIGAISKTKHSVLRYRDPIYKNVRELVMTYFHEYFLNDGKKNLRSYSNKYNVFAKNGMNWIIADKDLYEIAYQIDNIKHTKILNQKMVHNLRKADNIEIKASNVL